MTSGHELTNDEFQHEYQYLYGRHMLYGTPRRLRVAPSASVGYASYHFLSALDAPLQRDVEVETCSDFGETALSAYVIQLEQLIGSIARDPASSRQTHYSWLLK